MREPCDQHPLEPAGWRCDACSALLCPRCAALRQAGTAQVETCMRCGGYARTLMLSRGSLEPFDLQRLLGALRWPFSRVGLITILASDLLYSTFGFFGSRARGLAVGVLIAYLFQIVRHTALGKDDFPAPDDFRGYREDVVMPSWRLFLALAWIWIPATVLLWQRRPDPVAEQQRAVQEALKPGGPGLKVHGMRVVTGAGGGMEVIPDGVAPPPPSPEQLEREQAAEAAQAKRDVEESKQAAQEPAEGAPTEAEPAAPQPAKTPGLFWPLLLVLLGVAIAPMSVLASALNTPLSVAVNPLVLAGHAVRLGRDYLLLVGFCLAVVLAQWVLGAASLPLLLVPFGALLRNFALLLLPFGLFRAVGMFVRARGADLGYGGEEAYLVPALGGAQPAGALPDTQTVAQAARQPRAPIELDDAEPAQPPHAQPAPEPLQWSAAAIELSDEPIRTEDAVTTLARLVAAADLGTALAHLEATAPPALALSTRAWLDLGRQGLSRKQAKPAIMALRRCIELAPRGEHAPQAFLLAARAYDEGLRDRPTSDKLLAELLRRFPDSAEGRFAAARLKR